MTRTIVSAEEKRKEKEKKKKKEKMEKTRSWDGDHVESAKHHASDRPISILL